MPHARHALFATPTTPTTPTRLARRPWAAIVSGLIVAVLAITGVVATSTPAIATTGLTLELTGQVQIPDDNGDLVAAGLDDVMVTAWLLDTSGDEPVATPQDSQTTDADGQITFDPLVAGYYAFEYSYRGGGTINVANGFGDGGVTLDEELANSGTAFTEIIEDGFLSLDYDMAVGGIIQGHARTAGSVAIPGQPVELWRQSQAASGETMWLEDANATTDVVGDYLFSSLPGGTYTVRVGGAANYIPEFWEDQLVATAEEADTFPISTGGGIHEITSVLGLGGRVTGTVKNTAAQALPNVVATAYIDNGTDFLPFASALTGLTGGYTIGGLPAGSYRVGFSSSELASVKYIDRYWTAAATLGAAQSFTLATGATKSAVNVTMTKGASISGVVTLEGGGFPLATDVEIRVCDEWNPCHTSWSESYGVSSYNQATGVFSVGPLPAGRFTLHVQYLGAANFRSESFNDAHRNEQSTPIVVAASASVTGKNIQLDHGTTISGQVLADGTPRAGVRVGVYDAGHTAGIGDPIRTAISNPSGLYTITGLDDGTYSLRAEPTGTLAWQWSNGVYDSKLARVVAATGGNAATGADFDLETGASISGQVTTVDDGLDAGYSDVNVYRFTNPGDDDYRVFEEANRTMFGNGEYFITQLPPGQYAVGVGENISENTLARFYGGTGVDPLNATRLDLAAGDTATADVALDRAGSYVGRVVDENGLPVVGAKVTAGESWELCEYYIDCTTDFDGYFSLRQLMPGAHTITVEAPDGSGYVKDVMVAGPATTVNALPVDIGDVVLENGSVVSGIVIGVDGKALRDVSVTAWKQGADNLLYHVGDAGTDSSGRFELDRLPSDPVFLEFYPNGPTGAFTYSDQFLGGNFDWALSESIPLPLAGTKAFVEARLLSGAIISGVVTNKATGAGIPGVDVEAILTNTIGSTWYGNYRQTNTKGAFSLPGMEPGSYTVSYSKLATGPGLAGDTFSPASKTVFVPERATVAASIALTAGIKLSGVIRDGTNAVVPFADITAYPVAGNTAPPVNNLADQNGAYTFYLPPGKWILYGFDYFRQGSGVFSGGVFTPATASQITLVKTAVVANLTLPTATSSIHANSVFGTNDPNPSGSVTLERIVGGDVVSTEYWGSQAAYGAEQWIGAGFTLANVPEGEYRVTVTARPLGAYGEQYDVLVIEDVHVVAGEIFELGDLDLGAAHEWDDSYSVPVSGSEPSLQLVTSALQVGGMLHVDAGTWTGSPTGFDYRWLRNGHAIPGAAGDDYVLAPGDAGASISVRLTPLNGDSYYNPFPGTLASIAGTVAPGDAAFPIDVPIVTGTSRVGQVLTVSKGNWNLPGLTFSYQWLRGGTPIAAATAATYKPVALDVGAAISVRVTATRAGFVPATYDVAVSPIQPATAMSRTVAGAITATLTGWKAAPGTWVPASTVAVPTTFSYVWRVYDDAGVPIDYPGTSEFVDDTIAPAGVKGSTDRVTVLITATKAGYTPTTIEVPVRLGPVPHFADTGAAQLVSTGPDGAAQVGYPITLDGALAMDPKPANGVYSYQWSRSAANAGPFTAIAGATTTSYTPVALDVNKYLSVAITLKATGRVLPTAPQWRYVFGAVTQAAQAFTTPDDPVITGDNTVGSTLTVVPGTWDPAPTTFAYQWLRNNVAISGATKATYVLAAVDNGKYVTVRVTGSKSGLVSLAKVSPIPVVVTGADPFVPAPPVITGDPNVGQKLTATPGAWTPAPTTFSYQWFRGTTPISGATKATYVVVAADNGKEIKVRTTGAKAGLPNAFSEASVTIGAALPTTIVTAPSIGTVARVGVKLTATSGSWLLPPTSYLYQWYLNGVPIGGATASSYTPIIGDLGEEISVAVTAKKTGFPDSAPAQSASATVEPGAAISASAVPKLSVLAKATTTVKLGQTVATTAGTWPVAALSLEYQWQVDRLDGNGFVDLFDANTKSLFVDPDGYYRDDASGSDDRDFDIGYKYRVVVSAQRVGYLQGPDATSSAVTIIP